MISRRALLAATLPALALAKAKISGRMGLQIYSLRTQAEKDLPGTLAFIRGLGFREVEVSALYGHSSADFRRMLDQNGLRATSMMAEYDRFEKDCDAVAADAHKLGAEYVVCGTIPHRQRYLSAEDCEFVAPKLNSWGGSTGSGGFTPLLPHPRHRV